MCVCVCVCVLLSLIYYSKYIIHCFCTPIMHYNNLEEKTNEQENRVVQILSNVFSHVQPLWIKLSNGFFDPVHQISFQFVQVDPQLWRCAFCSPLNSLESLFLKQRTQVCLAVKFICTFQKLKWSFLSLRTIIPFGLTPVIFRKKTNKEKKNPTNCKESNDL